MKVKEAPTMRTAEDVAHDFFSMSDERPIEKPDMKREDDRRILEYLLTAFRNDAIEEAAKMAEGNFWDSLSINEKAEIWLSNQIRALKK